MFSKPSTFVAAVAATLMFATSAETGLTRRGNISPALKVDFPDPALIKADDGYHAFATNAVVDNFLIHVQMAHSPDFKTWSYRTGQDAMPSLAPWIDPDTPKVWAPDVVKRDDGTWILYFAAAQKSNPDVHCLGWATSNNIEGPYVHDQKLGVYPWICPAAQGGAIDPSGYIDSTGKRWVVYKVDGNSIGHGGACNNDVAPIVPTPIMLQQVNAANAYEKIGDPIQLITNTKADGPNIENPSLTYLGGKYVLFFSSQCFATTKYDVSYAIADTITGPYTKWGPLFVTGTDGLKSPGGLDIAVNGDHAVWHGNTAVGRAMYTGIMSLSGHVVKAQV